MHGMVRFVFFKINLIVKLTNESAKNPVYTRFFYVVTILFTCNGKKIEYICIPHYSNIRKNINYFAGKQ